MSSFLTIEEIAEDLKVERKTVVSWITSGRLIAIKPGGGRLWRVRLKDYLEFVGGETQQTTTAVWKGES